MNLSPEYLLSQIFNGLVSGGFYALLSLGLSIIFGMLRIVNFAHGTMYMLGAFVAYYGLSLFHLPFFAALIVAPLVVAIIGLAVERLLLQRLYSVDPLYNLLLTFALVLVVQDAMRLVAGAEGSPYATPDALSSTITLGSLVYPVYRLFVIVVSVVVCLAVWYALEKTPLGARIRAATENPTWTRAFGINTSVLISGVFAFGVALAALAGVLAAPSTNVQPLMGDDIIIKTFAIVVIGGMGSIMGSVVTGFTIGVLTAIGAVFFPQISDTLTFILMVVVLLVRPAGLFGQPEGAR